MMILQGQLPPGLYADALDLMRRTAIKAPKCAPGTFFVCWRVGRHGRERRAKIGLKGHLFSPDMS
jgi:hypothetical protein